MKTPLISICISAFNADKFLEATLRTVESQTLKDWELIVTEDGSRDRTEELVMDFSIKAPQNVTYKRHPLNRGLPATRNTGAATASGEWIVFLDADDLWKTDHLETLVSASHIEPSDAVFSGSIQYDDATWTKLSTRTPTDRDLRDLPLALYSGHLSIIASAVMIKREALQRFGPFSTEFPVCCSSEYWLRLLSQGGRLFFSGANTCIYRQHNASLSRTVSTSLLEMARVCECYANWAGIPRLIARTRTASLYRQAGRSLLAENPSDALAPLARSLRWLPFAPNTLSLWIKAFLLRSFRRTSHARQTTRQPFPATKPAAKTPAPAEDFTDTSSEK